MHYFRHLATIGTLIVSQSALAAAFQLYELGTPIIGSAGVGQAVVADASSSYFNPAAMTKAQQSEFMLGSQLLVPFNKFSLNNITTISGDSGGNAATLIPGLDMYYIYSYSPKLKLGINLTSPYGGELDYNDGWAGRYIVQFTQFYTLDLNPSIAYQFNNWFSAGAGVTVEYMNLHETVALPLAPLIDGQVNIKAANTSTGFNVGALFTPGESTRIGLTYRSRISHNLTGNATFLRIGASPNTTSKMVMPQNMMLSVSQAISQKLTLLGEVGWANWSTMKNTIVNVAGYTAITPLNWNSTYRLGLAAHYQPVYSLTLQAGASVDQSPTNTANRLPDLPMDRQTRIGAGLVYAVTRPIQIGFSYEYINFGRARINNTSTNGVLSGSYPSNFANVVQASINVDC